MLRGSMLCAVCMPVTALLVLSLLLAPLPAAAQKSTVIYRCTDATGVVTLQNDMACPKGSQQEKRTIEAATAAAAAPFPTLPPPASAPPLEPMDAVPTPVGPTRADANIPGVLPLPSARTSPSERLPPPPLYQCNTVENDSYLSDTPDPKPRCVRLDTVGIDGTQQGGAGQACSMVYDQCQRVADNAACAAWRQRVNQAQSAWTFARADSADALKAEYERIARVVAETTCNQ